MDEIEILKRKYEREKKAREILENMIEGKTRELFITNRKIENEKLRLEMYLEVAEVMIVVIDLNKKVTLINQKGCDVLGYKKEEIIGKDWIDNFVPEDKKVKVREVFDKLLTGDIGSVEYFENTVLNKRGEKRIISWHNSVLKDENGRINAVLRSGEDITESKKAGEKLIKSENKYRTLLANLPQKIFLKDKDLVYMSCNENYAQDLNIQSTEITGKTDYDYFTKELAEKYRADDKRIMESGNITDIQEEYIQDKNKVFVHTIKIPVRDENGNVVGILGIFWDITDQKKANEALQESEEKFRLLFENAGDGILIVDPESKKFIAANNELCHMTKYSLEELLTIGVEDIHPKEHLLKVIKEFEKQVRRETELAKDIPVLRKDGTVFYADINSKPFSLKGKNYLIGIFRDTSERKTLEEERMVRSNLETIQSMMVTINHEMNQPLAIIISSSDFVLKKVQRDSEIYEDVKIINAEAWRLAKLIKKTNEIKTLKTKEYTPGTKMVDLDDV